MTSRSVFLWDSLVCKQESLFCLCLFLGPFLTVCSVVFLCVSFCFIIFIALLSLKRLFVFSWETERGWVWKWRETVRNRDRGSHNQDILYESKIYFNKIKEKHPNKLSKPGGAKQWSVFLYGFCFSYVLPSFNCLWLKIYKPKDTSSPPKSSGAHGRIKIKVMKEVVPSWTCLAPGQ